MGKRLLYKIIVCHYEPMVAVLVVELNRIDVFLAVDVYARLVDDARSGELFQVGLLREHLLQWHRLLRLPTGRWIGVLRRNPHISRIAIHRTTAESHCSTIYKSIIEASTHRLTDLYTCSSVLGRCRFLDDRCWWLLFVSLPHGYWPPRRSVDATTVFFSIVY